MDRNRVSFFAYAFSRTRREIREIGTGHSCAIRQIQNTVPTSWNLLYGIREQKGGSAWAHFLLRVATLAASDLFYLDKRKFSTRLTSQQLGIWDKVRLWNDLSRELIQTQISEDSDQTVRIPNPNSFAYSYSSDRKYFPSQSNDSIAQTMPIHLQYFDTLTRDRCGSQFRPSGNDIFVQHP